MNSSAVASYLWTSPLYEPADACFENHEDGAGLILARQSMRGLYNDCPHEIKLQAASLLNDFWFEVLWPTSERAVGEDFDFNSVRSNKTTLAAFFAGHVFHKGHTRKDNSTPYFLHPIRVALDVFRNSRNRTDYRLTDSTLIHMVDAALLHDTVEDTSAEFGDLSKVVSFETVEYVFWLTDLPKEAGNRALRKMLSQSRLMRAPTEVKLIKYADILDNYRTSDSLGSFRDRFLKEKAALLSSLMLSVEDMTFHRECRRLFDSTIHDTP